MQGITLAPKKLILTRRASEGSASKPSLARRVSMCKDAKLSCRGNKFGQALRNPLNVTSYKPIRLTSAVAASNPMTSMVSLLPSIKPNLSQSDRILIIAADLTDAYGRPIDGNDDGVPGGNYVATLSRSGVTFSAVPLALARTTGKPTATSAVVDALLARDELASVTRAHRPRREPVAALT